MATVKEILDTEIPRPTWTFRPGYKAPLPEGMTVSRPSAARTLDPVSGLYTSVPSNEKRVFGPQQNLLVEGQARTNHLLQSADISSWNLTGGTNGVSVTSATSLIDNETAHEVTGGGASDDFAFQDAGTFSGNTEVAHIRVERGTADLIALGVQNASTGSVVALVEYDWANGATTVVSGSADGDHIRILTDDGGNGGEAVDFILRISGGNAENTSGESRQVRVYPDRNGNGNSVFSHHAQIEEALNTSPPIVTGSSEVTRSADVYQFPVGDWYTEAAAITLYLEFTHQFYDADFPRFLEAKSVSDFLLFNNESRLRINNSIGSSQDVAKQLTPYENTKFAISYTDSQFAASFNGKEQFTGGGWGLINETSGFDLSLEAPTVLKEMRFIPNFLSTNQREVLTS